MKSFARQIAAAVALVVLNVGAFQSEKWLAERGDDSDMRRLSAAFDECSKKIESPAENVKLPIETYPDGTVKSRLTAARAHMFVDSPFVWAEGVRVEQFKQDGTLSALLTADNCVIDRTTRSGWVAGSAQMVYGETTVSGRGIYFSLPREFIKVFSQSEIRTKHGGFNPGSLVK